MPKKAKYQKLINSLKNFGSAAIAFSGGVDSTFLMMVAKEALGGDIIAFTIASPYIAQWEIEEAKELARKYHVNHVILKVPMLDAIKHNPVNRCYLCKKEIFKRLQAETKKHGFTYLLDGTNNDDLKDDRPGIKALKELKVKSPLAENGFTKKDIRFFSKELHLPTWDKPAYACLLTRIPFKHDITLKEIQRIEKAEKYLIDLGFKAVRVRSHGDLARIEVNRENRKKLVHDKFADTIAEKMKKIGFAYVTVDIQGYRTGSLNESINKSKRGKKK